MTALRELFAKFTTEFDAGPLIGGAAAVDGLFGKLKHLGTALAGGAIVGGIAALTREVIHEGDELATTADRLGIATQALQQWQYVADLADVSQEELSAGLRILQKNLFSAAQGGGDAAADFKRVGVSLADLKKGDLDAVLTKAADGFAALTNPIEKTALAQKLLGRGGAALVPLLSKGAAGVQELKDEFLALGGGLNDETIAAANEADDAFKRMNFSIKSLVHNAVKPLIEGATFVANQIRDWVKHFNQLSKGSSIVEAGLVALGVVASAVAIKALIAFAPLILTTLAWAAAIGAAVLLLDDVITLFKGGKSVIGEWIDANYGAGTSSKWVQDIKQWWDELKPSVDEAGAAFKGILPTLETVGKVLSAIGQTIAFVADQFKSKDLEGQAGDLLHFIKKDFGKAFGLDDEMTSDEKRNAHGADGIGSGAPTERGGIFSMQRLAGDMPSLDKPRGAFTLPEVTVAAGGGGKGAITLPEQTVIVNVAANAKPDPQLLTAIKGVVKDQMGAQNRELAAAIGGT